MMSKKMAQLNALFHKSFIFINMTNQVNIFKNAVRRILKEEVEASSTDKKIFKRVPEVNSGEDLKKVTPHPTEKRSKIELLDDMTKMVNGINKDFIVEWDDHDDMSIHAEDIFKIRIIPKWENNYCIEAYTQNEDRVYVTGQNWEQVKDFVKQNLKNSDTNVDKAYNKSLDSYKLKDTATPDKGLPQKDKPEHKKVSDTKNKNKDYNEADVKNEKDLQNKPMQEIGKVKTQSEFKVQQPQKVKKFKPDTKLVLKKT